MDIGVHKGPHVQAILRCRPLNDEEAKVNTPVVISCDENLREVTAVLSKQVSRTFSFDKVFGPSARQKDLYEQAIAPLVLDVLEGYNCTIFAYGQSGTGKTFTMEGPGRRSNEGDRVSDNAGIIPRAVKQIFDILERQNMDFSVKASFLELYNEEITDLLAPDDLFKKPLTLMEDGKGELLVRGLEEETLCLENDIFKILEKGSRRRTAETLVNKRSSRSHSIFTLMIHVKDCSHDGGEMIKTGKLNLVDLSGSENISRSGARDERARDAGEINKSLLTFGRVINSLVEHSCHVPYRESKLTRLLKDSLGGRTRTCVIATISPTIHCMEETLSTLDYAHRSRSIRNKPEINQKVMKSAIVKDYYAEIKQLRQEVRDTREKSGLYNPEEFYLTDEYDKSSMIGRMQRLELCVELKDKQLDGLRKLYNAQKLESANMAELLKKTQGELVEMKHAFQELEDKYCRAKALITNKEHFISNLLKSEKELINYAHEFQTVEEDMAAYMPELVSKPECEGSEEDNKSPFQDFQCQLIQQLDFLNGTISVSAKQQERQIREMEEDMRSFVFLRSKATDELHRRVAEFKEGIHCLGIEESLKEILAEAEMLFEKLQRALLEQEVKLIAFSGLQKKEQLRALAAARSALKLTSDFFENLDAWESHLKTTSEEARALHDRQLHEFEKKIEEHDAKEERDLIEMVKEMISMSSERKKRMVCEGLDSLRESAVKRINMKDREKQVICDLIASVKDRWSAYTQEAENRYDEDDARVELWRSFLQQRVVQCDRFAKMGSRQWRYAEGALLTLQKENLEALDSLLRSSEDRNQEVMSRLSSSASAALRDLDKTSEDLLSSSILCSSKLEDDMHRMMGYITKAS